MEASSETVVGGRRKVQNRGGGQPDMVGENALEAMSEAPHGAPLATRERWIDGPSHPRRKTNGQPRQGRPQEPWEGKKTMMPCRIRGVQACCLVAMQRTSQSLQGGR